MLLQTHGVPQFFGIYFAMGFALILEGFMSSFYHICPNDSNFQFGKRWMLHAALKKNTIYTAEKMYRIGGNFGEH